MAEKKTTGGVKSVSLADVKAVEAKSGIKAVGSSSYSSVDPDQDAKDLDDDVKRRDEEAKQADQEAKDADREWKQAEKAAKKMDRRA